MGCTTDLSIGKSMTMNLAWCAGLYEGEGTIVYGESHRGPLRVKLSSTDPDVLDLLCQRSGVGSVSGPYEPRGFGRKQFYEWRVQGAVAVDFLMAIRPWLGRRRRARVDEKIALWQDRPQRIVKVTPQVRRAILRERAAGKVYREIAERYDISIARVHQICTEP